ncbi:MAG: indolepyruvate ferredoxin oxidoreductase subunit alpha [Dehalococcoidia bacterium]
MIIKDDLCTGCLECLPYCPMEAIVQDEKAGRATIIEDECVECGVCYRARVCGPDAIYPQNLEWPRTLRMEFSDPSAPYMSPVFEHRMISRFQAELQKMDRRQLLDREGEALTISGRGTVEMKMNDVMGRFRRGRAGVAAEVGRPGVGARFRDVQTVTRALASLGVRFEPQNPLTDLMADIETGTLREDILNEKVLSCIIEFDVPLEGLAKVLAKMREVAEQMETVFAVDLISVVNEDGSIPTLPIVESLGLESSIAGKTNVGLGRPLANLD